MVESSGRKVRANPAQEHEDRRFATRPLVAARFRKEAVLTLFESVTYLFVPAGTRIPYCGSVLVWAARFFEKKRGSAFLCSPNQSPPLSNRPLACYLRDRWTLILIVQILCFLVMVIDLIVCICRKAS